ncbi:MAG: metallophosphoesterase [Pseudomonadota bacterium]|nr:metallophosphoesterase [Pseudomonadota bacterium]
MSYPWSAGPHQRVVRRIPADRPVWVVSDLHLGNGGRSDSFMGKDRALFALLDQVRAAGATLVINGDAIDFLQAGDFTAVLHAHGKLLRAFADLAATHGVWYVVGNHDQDLHVYRDLLRFEVCDELWIGEDTLVEHGHGFDPWIGANLNESDGATRFHHWVEHAFGTWIRLPLADFYTRGNRVCFWLFHKYTRWLALRNTCLRKLGMEGPIKKAEFFVDYWVRNEAGDPMLMFRPALAAARARGATTVVCGHSHMPANVLSEGTRFVNCGSWTFGWAQYAVLDGGTATVRDWLSGREYGDELYRPLLDGELDRLTFDRWWRNQYLGWFRFRSGELRRTALQGPRP